ncbi:potassium channel subfamily K member 2-like isoform X2 [Pomacea canaliculata]|uniref:potassium channel subfamily K member 2-like isoform X2 n=1 Tax=Pomacea canaliculata TaxID=400727 RepID=UPI000D72BE2F|nr:potassium channel subfamily K member 2-like isoform X2 [Pomacea canaliculata]
MTATMMETRRLLVLLAVMTVYLCVGAAVFNALEAGDERGRKDELERSISWFISNYTCVDESHLKRLLRQASMDGELVFYIINNKTHLDRWDFSGSLGFAISVVTTIGFGNLAPHTNPGKIMCVIYAFVGIPFMMVLLAGIGDMLMVALKRIANLKLCPKKRRVNRILNMLVIIVLGIVVGFLVPATVFHIIEDWHILEALYFCFTTLCTIGFGDYIIGIHEQRISEGPLHEAYEVLAYIWILFGLSYVSLIIKYISDILASNAELVERKTVQRLESFLGVQFCRLKNGDWVANCGSLA